MESSKSSDPIDTSHGSLTRDPDSDSDDVWIVKSSDRDIRLLTLPPDDEDVEDEEEAGFILIPASELSVRCDDRTEKGKGGEGQATKSHRYRQSVSDIRQGVVSERVKSVCDV